MQTKLNLFFKWGIVLDTPYEVERKSVREVKYADRDELIEAILNRMPQEPDEQAEIPPAAKAAIAIIDEQNTKAKLQKATEGVK
jgi:hypothetical protein